MKIERAIQILDPEHRERYNGLEEVNEACRMGMAALRIAKEIAVDNDLARELREAVELIERGVNLPGHRSTMRRAAELLESVSQLCDEGKQSDNVVKMDSNRREG